MANRIGAFSVVMLAGMAAHGQSVEMAMRQSYEKAIFFSGQVKLDDASAPPEPVAINRVCNGQSHFETWTDAKGRFSFQVTAGGNDAGQADATQNSTPPDVYKRQAHHHDLLPAVKKAVAGGTGADAVPNQLVLGFQAQPPRRGARGDDHSPRFRPLAFDVEAERPRRKIRIEHRAVDILRAEVLRLPLHVLDQLRTVDTFRKAGKILHQRGHRELPARFVATNHDWFQIRTRRVNSRRIPRAPRTDDDNIPHKDFDEKFSVPQAAVGLSLIHI